MAVTIIYDMDTAPDYAALQAKFDAAMITAVSPRAPFTSRVDEASHQRITLTLVEDFDPLSI